MRLPKRVLVTGGAGFVGSHLCDQLLRAGHHVRALDNLCEQVHGANAGRPAYLAPEVELIVGDVRDAEACRRAVAGVDVLYHLAAAVGVGQSMYEIERYCDVNTVGTATLLEQAVHAGCQRIVVASSMSIYGEGLYRDGLGRVVEVERTLEQLRHRRWDALDEASRPLRPLPTPEDKTARLASVYALGKYTQERLCLVAGRAYGIPAVALRFFNIYGPRQALSNPYTGVLAIFGARLLNGRPPLVNEDGLQRRDFVSVHDVARACVASMEVETDPGEGLVLNIGSGEPHTIRDIAHRLGRLLGRADLEPVITGDYRAGDIRHCYADIAQARRRLKWEPRVALDAGLEELAGWLVGQTAVDRVESARAELERRGLAS
jgi:dTDP-L-rhamnose 4-epimerase